MAIKLSLAKTHGGKGGRKVLNWILSQFPKGYENIDYIEPFVGGGSVILNKAASPLEAINDIHTPTFYMYMCAKNALLQRVANIDYNENTFKWYRDSDKHISKWAIAEREYVLRNMSRGGMGKDFAWSNRLRGGQPGDVNAWVNKVKQLTLIQKRLKDVKIHNEDVISFMKKYNTDATFAYLDPPYLSSTRTSKKIYDHEMSLRQHEELLDFLKNEWAGTFLLSGYISKLYEERLTGYNMTALPVSNNAGQTKKKSNRTEYLWRNY